MRDNKTYWVALNRVQQIGNTRLQHLLDYFGSAKAAWHASTAQLRDAGLNGQALKHLSDAQQSMNIDQEWERVKKSGVQVITIQEDAYPPNLREIPDPPMMLYVRGNLLPTDVRALGIVGTRRATRYGSDAANRMAYWLAGNEITIISGMAHGIDAAAHQGALDAGGRTFAVMGCGIDIIYPREHDHLARRIAAQGAIISELPLGMPPTGSNFPRRNRLISGLALGVMIAEAPERSGALITAEAALEQGRDVFAIPANIFNPMGTGSNKLIQDGAKLVMRAQDVLDELQITYTEREIRTQTEQIAPENDLETTLLNLLDSEPMHVDDLIRQTGIEPSQVMATLAILELKGLAQSVGHMQYCLAR